MRQLSLPLHTVPCRFYAECSAPLCPQEKSRAKVMWFPGEPVCRLRKTPEWVGKQRLITRVRSIDASLGFSIAMLSVIKEVEKDIQGADPDSPASEKSWLARQARRRAKIKSVKVRKPKPTQGRLQL